MLVSSIEYPSINTSKEWISARKRKIADVLEAADRAFGTFSTAIHPDDEMWGGLLVGQEGADRKYLRTHYFFGGRSAIRNITEALIATEAPLPKRVLDFPCSHGRVTRFLRTAYPDAELFVGDLNYPGVDFCSAAFNATPVYSLKNLSEAPLPADMDVIWCSSLATHLPEAQCLTLFNRFADTLAPGGVAGITTCGRGMDHMQRNVYPTIDPVIYEQIVRDLSATGFGYHDYPGVDGYGMTFIDSRWIQKFVNSRDDVILLSFRENAWHGWQDIVWLWKRPLSQGYNWDTGF